MTTDITELAQSLKAAAEKATPGQWVAFIDTRSRTFAVHTPDDNRCGNIIKWTGFDGQRKAKANAEFIALASPANILALVEALEKAQRHANLTEAERQAYLGLISKRDERIAEQEEAEQKLCAANVTLDARAKLAERQLAELESRTVKLPGWFVKDAIAVYDRDEIEEALAAAGIKVEAE